MRRRIGCASLGALDEGSDMTQPFRLEWKGPEFVRKLDERLSRNLDSVGVFLQGEIVRSFGSPSAPPEGGAKTPVLGLTMRAKTFRAGQHSKPGEPPFVQTGTLRRSITFAREGLRKLLIGSSLKPQRGADHSYAWLLEMGSPGGQLAARPYLRPAVRKNKRKILSMLCAR